MIERGLARRVIAARKSPALQVALALIGVALAAGLRWSIDRGANGVPFVTFVPVLVLSAVFLQWQFAALAAVMSLGTVVLLFGPYARIEFTVANYVLWGAFAFSAAFIIGTGHLMREMILELDAQSARTRIFNAELQHRTKNMLQMVRALASRAARTTDPAEFYTTLSGRLDALAKANDMLGPGTRQTCAVADLVAAAMQPFPTAAITAAGTDCAIAGDAGVQLMMALHELGTNAMKYGALSIDSGQVTISWERRNGLVELHWVESGGPPVLPPANNGLGSRLLSPGGPLKAVQLDFRPQGVMCRLAVEARG